MQEQEGEGGKTTILNIFFKGLINKNTIKHYLD
jgi:hypothetical protein